MSTGPGPTRKPDGDADASVDDIADLLVEDESSAHSVPVDSSGESSDDGLDVMLETPGPAVANPFMPPPPSPMEDVGDSAEENETADDSGADTNLAYEDLLAKLVLPAKAPEPEPEMPAVMSSLPLPESVEPLTPILSPPPSFPGPAAPSLQIAPPTDERTLVTENPLVAEEQEAAVREGRMALRPESPVIIHEQARGLTTEPIVVAANGMAKSRLVYLMLGGLLVLGGMILAVLVLKLLMPTPPPQPPAIIVPTPAPLPPQPVPPAHVEPLPPTAPPAAAIPEPLPAAAPENPSGIPETAPTLEPERPQPRPRPALRPRAPRAAPRAIAPKATTPKAAPSAPARAAKSSSAKKPSKTSGYADPFDN